MCRTCCCRYPSQFPDTIGRHYSNFDAASFPDASLLLVKNYKGPRLETDVPCCCLSPKGLDGILVVGRGAGAEQDAVPAGTPARRRAAVRAWEVPPSWSENPRVEGSFASHL